MTFTETFVQALWGTAYLEGYTDAFDRAPSALPPVPSKLRVVVEEWAQRLPVQNDWPKGSTESIFWYLTSLAEEGSVPLTPQAFLKILAEQVRGSSDSVLDKGGVLSLTYSEIDVGVIIGPNGECNTCIELYTGSTTLET